MVKYYCSFWKYYSTALPNAGVYIHGLYLDGAGWDRRNARLIEPTAKVLYTSLPVVHVSATNQEKQRSATLYDCPVYKKPKRTDLTYIFPLSLKTQKPADYWVLRGVALLCDIKWSFYILKPSNNLAKADKWKCLLRFLDILLFRQDDTLHQLLSLLFSNAESCVKTTQRYTTTGDRVCDNNNDLRKIIKFMVIIILCNKMCGKLNEM